MLSKTKSLCKIIPVRKATPNALSRDILQTFRSRAESDLPRTPLPQRLVKSRPQVRIR
jgi:hypothetical protein